MTTPAQVHSATPADADVHEATRAALRHHGQFAGLVRATTTVRAATTAGSPAATATIEQVESALHALVRAGEASPHGRGGWQWRSATFPALYLTIDAPGDRFAAPLYAGVANHAYLHLAPGSYTGHYSDRRHTNAPVLVTLDQDSTGVLMLACGQCPPTFDERSRPLHRRGCPGR